MAGYEDNCGIEFTHATRRERRILVIVLLINASMFLAEYSAGLVGGSAAPPRPDATVTG